MLKHEHLVAKIGFETAKNGPLKVCQKLVKKLEKVRIDSGFFSCAAAQMDPLNLKRLSIQLLGRISFPAAIPSCGRGWSRVVTWFKGSRLKWNWAPRVATRAACAVRRSTMRASSRDVLLNGATLNCPFSVVSTKKIRLV